MSSAELIPLPGPVPLSASDHSICRDQSPDRVQAYLDSARARNTIRGYRSSFRQFVGWCDASGFCPLPADPETIALYLSDRAGRLKTATLAHHLAAIAKAHKTAGLASPATHALVAETLKGIRRVHGSAQTRKAPVLTDDLRVMLRHVPAGLLGIRDRALLLVGFAGAFRRSELVSLDAADLNFQAEGLLITLRRSKTDQEAEGREVAIPYGAHPATCPVTVGSCARRVTSRLRWCCATCGRRMPSPTMRHSRWGSELSWVWPRARHGKARRSRQGLRTGIAESLEGLAPRKVSSPFVATIQ
jgi:hypothetical protein